LHPAPTSDEKGRLVLIWHAKTMLTGTVAILVFVGIIVIRKINRLSWKARISRYAWTWSVIGPKLEYFRNSLSQHKDLLFNELGYIWYRQTAARNRRVGNAARFLCHYILSVISDTRVAAWMLGFPDYQELPLSVRNS